MVKLKPLASMWAIQSWQQPQLGSFQTSTGVPVAARTRRGASRVAPARGRAAISRWRRLRPRWVVVVAEEESVVLNMVESFESKVQLVSNLFGPVSGCAAAR